MLVPSPSADGIIIIIIIIIILFYFLVASTKLWVLNIAVKKE